MIQCSDSNRRVLLKYKTQCSTRRVFLEYKIGGTTRRVLLKYKIGGTTRRVLHVTIVLAPPKTFSDIFGGPSWIVVKRDIPNCNMALLN